MKAKSRLKFLPGDLIIYLLVAAAAVCSALAIYSGNAEGVLYAEVLCGGEVKRYPLGTDAAVELSGGGYTLTLIIENGGARISVSDCPDKLCVRTGEISRAGQAIICVPARVTVRITGGRGYFADAVAG